MINAIYPGTFDPVNLINLETISFCLDIFDNFLIAIIHNGESRFTEIERVSMLEDSIEGEGLDYKREIKVCCDFPRLIEEEDISVIIEDVYVSKSINRLINDSLYNQINSSEVRTFFIGPTFDYLQVNEELIDRLLDEKKIDSLRKFVPKSVINYLN
ncbi:MAG TPA: hypothetical protein VKO61_00585 [Candidatus Paceibacterota bacterium]|nr:hypothetical protein [Candidatus Paceibacterota bacterium]